MALYVLAFPYHPALRSPNELSRLMQSRALIDFGEPSLNRAMRIYGPVGDLSYRDGLFYPSKAPLLSYAAAPIYAGLRVLAGNRIGVVPEIPLVFFARLLLTVLPTLITLIFLKRFLSTYVDTATADLIVVFYALGTLAFSYSLQFLSHQTSADLLFLAFYAAWRWARSDGSRLPLLVLAGLLAATAVTAEYTSAMAAGLLALWVPFARRGTTVSRVVALALFGLGAVAPLVLLSEYHARCFGSPFETGYKHLADAAYQPWHLGGFLGIRTPDPRALGLSLFSPLRGLFALSPGLVVGVVGLPLLWRKRQESRELGSIALLTVALLACYLYFTSSFSYESWGWTTGPRHMTGLVPFLLLPAALLVRGGSKLVIGISRGLLAASVLLSGSVTLVNYIPDSASEPLFGIVLPLLRRGDLVPSAMTFLGLANPWSGILFFIGIAAFAAFMVLARTASERPSTRVVLSGVGVMVVVLGLHLATYRDTPGDHGAVDLLSRAWLSPPGVVPRFWSTTGRP